MSPVPYWQQIPYGAFMATYEGDEALVAHWFVLQSPSRVDVYRNAEKAVLASGVAQAIHDHGHATMCNRRCQALVPSDGPVADPGTVAFSGVDAVLASGPVSEAPGEPGGQGTATEGQGTATEGPTEASEDAPADDT